MITRLLTAEEIDSAAALLQAGEPVGIPTETVYGLGCDAFQPDAVRKVFAAKGRPADNPLIVHIAALSDWEPLVTGIPPLAERLAKRFWPGPLTIILPRTARVPAVTAGGLDSVGVRFPAHPLAQAIIRAAKVPIAAPSANRSGSPSPTTAQHVMEDMDGRIPAVLDGGNCICGVESTVIALDDADTVRVLRPGFVTPEQLQTVAAHVIVDDAVLAKLAPNAPARSPGMKYKHYAPAAEVILLCGSADACLQYVLAQPHEAKHAVFSLVFDADLPAFLACGLSCLPYGDTDAERAAMIFARLRELDALGAKRVYIRAPRTDGVGLAVYNRLIRAAGYEVRTV